jgi:hypothetical protein
LKIKNDLEIYSSNFNAAENALPALLSKPLMTGSLPFGKQFLNLFVGQFLLADGTENN